MDAPSQARTVTLCKDLQATSAAFLTDSCINVTGEGRWNSQVSWNSDEQYNRGGNLINCEYTRCPPNELSLHGVCVYMYSVYMHVPSHRRGLLGSVPKAGVGCPQLHQLVYSLGDHSKRHSCVGSERQNKHSVSKPRVQYIEVSMLKPCMCTKMCSVFSLSAQRSNVSMVTVESTHGRCLALTLFIARCLLFRYHRKGESC